MQSTNNGKKGGLLKGKPHYDKDGKPLGGIKAIVTDSGQQVELEGGEVIINKEASQKHWKELSRINQSAGDGVPIQPPSGADDDDGGDDFEKGGKIRFNPNKLPTKKVYGYAKKIKEKYPKVWDMGGNIFGNEAYKNLERALNRGYWLDSEVWMFTKWQSFNARHSGDIRIAGIIANLKWLNVVDKGWEYMKNLIEQEIEKKYGGSRMAKGGKVLELIKESDAINNNGYFHYFKNTTNYADFGQKVPNVKSFYLITYNAGGQKNLKVMDTINPIELSNELQKLLVCDKSVARILLNEFISKAKKIDTSDLPNLEGKSIIIADRSNIVYNNILLQKGGELAKGIKVDAKEFKMKKGGTIGDYFSMADKEQFKQLMSLLNELIEKKFATDCFIEDKDNSVVFLTGKNVSDIKKNQIFNFINKTLKQKYDSFNLKKTNSTNNLNWIYADGELQGFKIYFRKDIIYAKGGELAKGIKVEKEHSKTAKKLYNREITPIQSFEEIAKEHLSEDENYYTKLKSAKQKFAFGGALVSGNFQIKTPTGVASKLSYMQQVLVRTSAFKKWFGDWQSSAKEFLKDKTEDNFYKQYKNISKNIDFETLEPQVLFHGTRIEDEFYVFDTVGNHGRPYGYFAYNKSYSENFSRNFARKKENPFQGMYEIFANAKNPLLMFGTLFSDKKYKDSQWLFYLCQQIIMAKYPNEKADPNNNKKHADIVEDVLLKIGFYVNSVYILMGTPFPFWRLMAYDLNGSFKAFMQSYDFDSVIYTEEISNLYDVNDPSEFTLAVTIFNPEQVKLADGRNVNFDEKNPDIRYKKGGELLGKKRNLKFTHHFNKLTSSILGKKYEDGGTVNEYEQTFKEKTMISNNREMVDNLLKNIKK